MTPFAELLDGSRPWLGSAVTAACMAALAGLALRLSLPGQPQHLHYAPAAPAVGAVPAVSDPAPAAGAGMRDGAGGAAPADLFWILQPADTAALPDAPPVGRSWAADLVEGALMIRLKQVEQDIRPGQDRPGGGGPEPAPGGDRGPVWGKRRGQDHADEMYPGLFKVPGDDHPGRGAHHPPEHRPLSFATCEHSFFPNLTPEGHREFYKAHFPTFRDKRFQALMDFFQLPSKQGGQLLHRPEKPAGSDPGHEPGGGLHPHG